MSNLEFNKAIIGSQDIAENEELLHQQYDLTQVEDEMNIIVGIDGGSTQTRCAILSATHQDANKLYVIPSVCSVVKTGKEIKSVDAKLYNNLDSSVVCLDGAEVKPNGELQFKNERIIRGSKFFNADYPETFIESGHSKIRTALFYINIIDAIGYTLVQSHSGQIPKKVNVRLGVALPNDDVKTRNLNYFYGQMKGSYQWSLTGTDLKVVIHIDTVQAITEPEAFIKAYQIATGAEIPEYQLHIEIGGRSAGSELLKRGIPVEASSKAFPYGGTQLMDMVANEIVDDLGGSTPSSEQLGRALREGVIKKGRNSTDVTTQVRRAKDLLAEKIFKDIMKQVFDTNSRVSFEDIEVISFSGRTFNQGEYEYSIADKLEELFDSRNPGNIEFDRIEGNYIPLGLIYSVFGSDGEDFIYDGYSDDEDEYDYEDDDSLDELETVADIEPHIEGEPVNDIGE
ncbi:hypothetical protein [uncultured Clostridium sp.]|uniref:hypothetical protein n=1 Tax=uncultured Clostridium sp. TaxID=59620 RepID=UPI0026F3B125|nr:hypothetical protein [uncultured Clostridium sp.]